MPKNVWSTTVTNLSYIHNIVMVNARYHKLSVMIRDTVTPPDLEVVVVVVVVVE